jgi:DNA-binding transcriptional MerR regulator
MPLFGKKAPARSIEIPTERVIQMRQQGYSNDQIIQLLQRENYTSSQIFDAMSQADIKGAVEGEPSATGGPIPMEAPVQEYQPQPMPPQMPAEMPSPQMPHYEMPPAMPSPSVDREAIEEVAESIIDEKWEELMKSVDKIIAWKEVTEVKIAKMDQRIKDLKERLEILHSGILSKVEEYDKSMKGVSTNVKAMEEVFKKVLPTFTANVSELSRMIKKSKESKPQK